MPKPGKILPVLEHIRVASPCNEDWDAMDGNDEVRFCNHCRRSVHNLSAMTRERALELVARSEGRLCVRYVQESSGEVVTTDTSYSSSSRWRIPHWAAGTALATALIAGTAAAQSSPTVATPPPASARDKAEGALRVYVVDETGDVVANAEVKVEQSTTYVTRSQTTNETGEAIFQNLPKSVYSVAISSTGFTSVTRTIPTVNAGTHLVRVILHRTDKPENVQIMDQSANFSTSLPCPEISGVSLPTKIIVMGGLGSDNSMHHPGHLRPDRKSDGRPRKQRTRKTTQKSSKNQ
jgi:hypothetical protein